MIEIEDAIKTAKDSITKFFDEPERIQLEAFGLSGDGKSWVETETFLRFRLADAAITQTAKDSCLVVTDDNPLFGYLVNQKIDTVNLDRIRMI